MHALIVDDSKTARYALRQLLDKQRVSSDLVESAEDALEYLQGKVASSAAPDLIFMDHMMPGMDGFEAVKELKSNPATASIPIVMYTSTQGGMYFGQARALGAADVINKPANAEDLREVLRRLLEQRPPVVVSEQVVSPEALVPNTISIGVASSGGSALPIADKQPDEAALYVEADNPARVSRAGYWLAALLLLPLLYFGSQHMALLQQKALLQQQRDAALRATEWAFNQSIEVPYGSIPFSDQRAAQLRDLLAYLKATGFHGRVAVESHVGVFCLEHRSAAGREPALVPVVSDIALTECAELGQSGDLREVSAVQSAGFRRFLQEAPQVDEGIQIDIRPRGAEAPLVEYSSEMGALEWNRVASRNQRIQILLEPVAL